MLRFMSRIHFTGWASHQSRKLTKKIKNPNFFCPDFFKILMAGIYFLK